jgi:hypothetical protein
MIADITPSPSRLVNGVNLLAVRYRAVIVRTCGEIKTDEKHVFFTDEGLTRGRIRRFGALESWNVGDSSQLPRKRRADPI